MKIVGNARKGDARTVVALFTRPIIQFLRIYTYIYIVSND